MSLSAAGAGDVDAPARPKSHPCDPRVSPAALSLRLVPLEEVADAEPDDLGPPESLGSRERVRCEVFFGRRVREDEAVHGQPVGRDGDHGASRQAERAGPGKLGHAGADALVAARAR